MSAPPRRTLRDRCRAFLGAEDGNVIITFAVTLVPVVGLVGAAIDYTRAAALRTTLQAAADSTALAVSKDAPTQTAAQLQAAAQTYFNALITNPEIKNIQVAANYSTVGGAQVVVTATASITPRFMSMKPFFGFGDLPVGVSSTTAWGMSRLRVALALDNTGSMASDGKMDALKAATKKLLGQLKAAATANGDVYVSIVPFSKDVNVGKTNYTASWIDWTDWDKDNVSGGSWGGSGGSGGWGGWGGGSGGGSTPDHSKWNGCVTDRGNTNVPTGQGYDQNVDPPINSNKQSLYPAEQYDYCPVEVMGLSYDWSALQNKVDSMKPVGSTNQPIGLVWAWLSLAGGGPFTVPAKDPKYPYSEVVILLSDGLNTQNRWSGNGATHSDEVDKRMYDPKDGSGTCKNIKAAGITVYTLQVNTDGDPKSTLLESCASDKSKFFLLTSADQIVTTFQTIGTNLSQLRVAK